MAKINRKTYTDAEKAFYIAEFQRLHKGGSRTYESIARELGVHVSSYYSWVAATGCVSQHRFGWLMTLIALVWGDWMASRACAPVSGSTWQRDERTKPC